MEKILEIVIADDWGSAFSIVGMLIVVGIAVHQFVKVSVLSAIMTIVVGIFVVNVLLAFGARLT